MARIVRHMGACNNMQAPFLFAKKKPRGCESMSMRSKQVMSCTVKNKTNPANLLFVHSPRKRHIVSHNTVIASLTNWQTYHLILQYIHIDIYMI